MVSKLQHVDVALICLSSGPGPLPRPAQLHKKAGN